MFSNSFHNGFQRFSQFSYVSMFFFFTCHSSPLALSRRSHRRRSCRCCRRRHCGSCSYALQSDVSFVEVDAGPCPLVPVRAQEKPAPLSPRYPKLSRRRIEMVHKKSPRLKNAFFPTMINIGFVGAGGFSCAHTGLKKMQKCVRPTTSSILGGGGGARSIVFVLGRGADQEACPSNL